MTDQEVKTVSRVAIYQIDEKAAVHQLLVQRPEDSKREANKLSMIGGTNTFEASSIEGVDPNAIQAALHLQNELDLTIDPQDLTEVDRISTVEAGTGIIWQEVCYMLELAGEPLTTFIDQQPHHGVARPIEWFTVAVDQTKGLIFHTDHKSDQPLRPIEGDDGEEGFSSDVIAFRQYLIVVHVMALIAAQEEPEPPSNESDDTPNT